MIRKLRVALIAAVLAVPVAAAAQETTETRYGGGCGVTKVLGQICASPDAAAAVVAFKPDGPVAGIMPGIGYKVEIFSERWFTMGLGAYIAIQTGADHTGVVTGLVSFARYMRMGVAKDLYATTKVYPVLGIGTDFGPSR